MSAPPARTRNGNVACSLALSADPIWVLNRRYVLTGVAWSAVTVRDVIPARLSVDEVTTLLFWSVIRRIEFDLAGP
ncbi:unannotated protein [freshwater metagenome]|uniref:Unannotated protein n=1 Tax=freshwater metagenome TaxID=449393 RepID=A0A6J6G2V2_9ZZZZ